MDMKHVFQSFQLYPGISVTVQGISIGLNE